MMLISLLTLGLSFAQCNTPDHTIPDDPPATRVPIQQATASAATPRLPPGWQWEIEPRQLRKGWREQLTSWLVPSGVLNIVQLPEQGLMVQHIELKDPSLIGSQAPQFAVYLIHEDGTSCTSGGSSGMGRPDLWVSRQLFVCDEHTHGPIVSAGLAILTFEGRKAASAAAMANARELGASVLPLPIIGEPYDFNLPDIAHNARRLRSADLHGKVVLIDCWATWCGPCMAKMPQLREVQAKFADDLVVIGINFDDELDTARKAITDNQLSWPQVHATSAVSGHDQLWEQATGITTLPRLLLINRQGVLVDDFYPHDLEKQIRAAIEQSPMEKTTTGGDTQ